MDSPRPFPTSRRRSTLRPGSANGSAISAVPTALPPPAWGFRSARTAVRKPGARHPPNRASRGIRRGPRADLARCRRDRLQARYLTRGGRPPERPDLTTQMPAACQHLSREGSAAGEGTSRPAAPGAPRRSAGGTRPGPRCSPKHESRARALPQRDRQQTRTQPLAGPPAQRGYVESRKNSGYSGYKRSPFNAVFLISPMLSEIG
jgi:hypothetical protein